MAAFADGAELDELKRRLDDRAVLLCQELFGDPTRRRQHEYRWGRKGSVQLVRRKGAWRWFNYETRESGSIFAAIMSRLGLDFAGAVAWAKEWLGEDSSAGDRIRARPQSQPEPLDVDADICRKQEQAQAMFAAGMPVARTPAERTSSPASCSRASRPRHAAKTSVSTSPSGGAEKRRGRTIPPQQCAPS